MLGAVSAGRFGYGRGRGCGAVTVGKGGGGSVRAAGRLLGLPRGRGERREPRFRPRGVPLRGAGAAGCAEGSPRPPRGLSLKPRFNRLLERRGWG